MDPNEASWNPDHREPRIWNPDFDLDGTGITNEKRAQWAERAVAGYENAKCPCMRSDPESCIQDLLTDLRHLCDREDVDWDRMLRMVDIHHSEERGPQRELHEDEGG